MKKFLTILFTLSLLLYLPIDVLGAESDFKITTNSKIYYTTGNDYANVKTNYKREVLTSSYYFPAQGEKIFHIPDKMYLDEEEVLLEQKFKIDSLRVYNSSNQNVEYSVEQKPAGEGIYVTVPNYKQTTSSSAYNITLEYNTHDLVSIANSVIVLQAHSLPEDIEFTSTDTDSKTVTQYIYDLSIITDKNMPSLFKGFPSSFELRESDSAYEYYFSGPSRVGVSPYLEFGDSQTFLFEIVYKTPKTDTLIPEEYSNIFKALSSNIYEISLPREYGETNQKVKIESISPTPDSLARDSEGNLIARYELPANQENEIKVKGYIYVSRTNPFTNPLESLSLSAYLKDIQDDSSLSKYLEPRTYWEVNDDFIQTEAKTLLKDVSSLYDVIKNDYSYVNEKLEYSTKKALSGNVRIGAKAALNGGESVCMEYADSLITLLRAQGIPARAALGYANLEILTNLSESQLRHEWVQIWVPDYGWFTIDPTYESENYLIGATLDRVLWETFNDDDLSNVRILSADTNIDTQESNLHISVIPIDPESIPSEGLKEYSEILSIQDEEEIDSSFLGNVNEFLKTTTVGKSLIITGPIFIFLVLITVLLTVVTKMLRKKKLPKDL